MYKLLLLSHFSHVRLCATPETTAHQALPSLGFSRQEHWSGLPFPSPGDLPDPGIRPESPVPPALQMGSLLLSHWESHKYGFLRIILIMSYYGTYKKIF